MKETRLTPQMNRNELIENLKTMVFGEQAFERFNAKERETLDVAIKTLEETYAIETCNLDLASENEILLEQIEKLKSPREVIYEGDGYADGEMVYDMARCPNCDFCYEESDTIWGLPYCPNCGQALKWDEVEE